MVGYWTSVKQRFECVANEEVEELRFGLGSKGVHISDFIRFLKA